jgi:hypothetical protein
MLKLTTTKPEPILFDLKTMPVNKLCRIIQWSHSMYIGNIIIKTHQNTIIHIDAGKGYWWMDVDLMSGTFVVEQLNPGDVLTVLA